MSDTQSKHAEGVAQIAHDILADSTPESHRQRRYNGRRHRFNYPPYHLATIGQVDEVLGCTGCLIRFERGVRVVSVRRDCKVHGR